MSRTKSCIIILCGIVIVNFYLGVTAFHEKTSYEKNMSEDYKMVKDFESRIVIHMIVIALGSLTVISLIVSRDERIGKENVI